MAKRKRPKRPKSLARERARQEAARARAWEKLSFNERVDERVKSLIEVLRQPGEGPQ